MISRDRAAGVFLILFAGYVLFENRVLPLGTYHKPGPGYMPMVLALILAAMAALVVVTGGGSTSLGTVSFGEWRHAVAILGSCSFAALALERLGYRLTVVVVVAFLVWIVERKSLLAAGLTAVGLALGSHYLFGDLLLVPLPRGPWGF